MIFSCSPVRPSRLIHESDLQTYSSTCPLRAVAAHNWIAANAAARNYAGEVNTGDFVGIPATAGWTQMQTTMATIIGLGFAAFAEGNHDRDDITKGTLDGSFPASARPYLTTYQQSANAYGFLELTGHTWGIAVTEWGPRDEVLTWFSAAIAAHPNTPWIFGTHAYLNNAGQRQDWTLEQDGGNPHAPGYNYTYPQGHVPNDGAEIWTKLIEPNSNIKIVLCGHNVAPGRLLTSTRADGSTCHQVMHSQHAGTVWGGADPELTIRELEFDYANREIVVSTYSPYTDTSADGFRLPMDSTT